MPTTESKRIQELNMLLAKRGDYIRHCKGEIALAEQDIKSFEQEITILLHKETTNA